MWSKVASNSLTNFLVNFLSVVHYNHKTITLFRHILYLLQGGSTAFAGFGGFSFKPTTTSTPVGFGFKTESKIGSEAKSLETPVKDTSDNKNDNNGSETPASRKKYLSSLKDLNQSVKDWIVQHVEKNPYCILTPIFKDYEKHLAQLEKEEKGPDTNGSEQKMEQIGIFKYS